jgi:hypothetical protein
LNYFKKLIDLGFSTKFHLYITPFSQEITKVLEKGLTAEHTIGATIDSKRTIPFFSYLSIF